MMHPDMMLKYNIKGDDTTTSEEGGLGAGIDASSLDSNAGIFGAIPTTGPFNPKFDPTHGLSGPEDFNDPTNEELYSTEKLLETLKLQGTFETVEETKHREDVLDQLRDLLKSFVRDASESKGLDVTNPKVISINVLPFGSYAYGAHFKNADMDLLCVCPPQISKIEFFKNFFELLAASPKITEAVSVIDAMVPVINLKFSGVALDLTFANLDLPTTDFDLGKLNTSYLEKLEPAVLRSINGYRVAKEIVNLVPHPETFQLALRFIKLWAKRRDIYSNTLGFFGGVAWAILVARICQRYPTAVASRVIREFFYTFSQWKWPYPVALKGIDYTLTGVTQWDPCTHKSDQTHLMPVLTPAFPSMCSTHNVTQMNQGIIEFNFERGKALVDPIIKGERTWDLLLRKDAFFERHPNYLQINVMTEDKSIHPRFVGNVESKLRKWILLMSSHFHVKLMFTDPKAYFSTNHCLSELDFANLRSGSTDVGLEKSSATPYKTVYTSSYYIGIRLSEDIDASTFLQRPECVTSIEDFKALLVSSGQGVAAGSEVCFNILSGTNIPKHVLLKRAEKPTPTDVSKFAVTPLNGGSKPNARKFSNVDSALDKMELNSHSNGNSQVDSSLAPLPKRFFRGDNNNGRVHSPRVTQPDSVRSVRTRVGESNRDQDSIRTPTQKRRRV